MSFKDIINDDLGKFILEDEFGESKLIDGRLLNILIDNDRLINRIQKEYEGASIGTVLYFVLVSDYGPKIPKPGQAQKFGSKPHTIIEVRENDGMYEIILDSNSS